VNDSWISAGQLSVHVHDVGGDKAILNDISFDIGRGKFVAVIGPSGCGKSTLVKALAGLIPASGSVKLGGHRAADLRSEYPLAIGYLPQFGSFHDALTVGETLAVATELRLPRWVGDVRSQWQQQVIDLAGLGTVVSQRYATLSGGQRRRIALGELLIGDPPFLFLDELTSGLDEHSDSQIMTWLRSLSEQTGKTIILVTHATYHLDICDSVIVLHRGQLVANAPHAQLLSENGVSTVGELFRLLEDENLESPLATRRSGVGGATSESPDIATDVEELAPQPLQTAKPPGPISQFPVLLARQFRLFWRDRGQLILQIALALIFPFLVAVFAWDGLPGVRSLSLSLETNVVRTLQEQMMHMSESFRSASLISGMVMFQVILLSLMGANNGAREIAKERGVVLKELWSGLSPGAFLASKLAQVAIICAMQSFWMAWFVKTICGFPGSLAAQFWILYAVTMAVSCSCLWISAVAASPERASLLSIYLVGFQLPLSGAALSLPDWLATICRPFISAYWGWSGYLRTLEDSRHFEVVRQARDTYIAPYLISIVLLMAHITISCIGAWIALRSARKSAARI
jgi:ABC-type multidrug transport system ATPase subunit